MKFINNMKQYESGQLKRSNKKRKIKVGFSLTEQKFKKYL